MSGMIIRRPWMQNLRRGRIRMKIFRGSIGECFMCGMATIGYKPKCLQFLEFTRMTFLGTLQWIPSCWIWERVSSTSSLQWQTWTSIIQLNTMNFKVPFICYYSFVSLCSLFCALKLKLSMNFVSTLQVQRIWSHEV
jgi:hypothetical protein